MAGRFVLASLPFSLGNFANKEIIVEQFYIIVGQSSDGSLTGAVAKRKFETQREAESHAVEVLKSNGTNNNSFFIMEMVSIAQRTSPPIEIVYPSVRPFKVA
jgi:hypothetical protein